MATKNNEQPRMKMRICQQLITQPPRPCEKNSIWTPQPHTGAVPSTASPPKAVWPEDGVWICVLRQLVRAIETRDALARWQDDCTLLEGSSRALCEANGLTSQSW